jgi:hypothetical protein
MSTPSNPRPPRLDDPAPEATRLREEWLAAESAKAWWAVFRLLEEIDPGWCRPGHEPATEAIRYIGQLAVLAGKWTPGSGWLKSDMLPADGRS